jgi:zinc transporter ZupT
MKTLIIFLAVAIGSLHLASSLSFQGSEDNGASFLMADTPNRQHHTHPNFIQPAVVPDKDQSSTAKVDKRQRVRQALGFLLQEFVAFFVEGFMPKRGKRALGAAGKTKNFAFLPVFTKCCCCSCGHINHIAAFSTNFTMLSAYCTIACSPIRQPCPSALPGSLVRQPCPAALSGSLVWQPCPAALQKSYKF